MSIQDTLAASGKGLFLDTKTPATKTAEEQKAESFAALLAEKSAEQQVAAKDKAAKIADHNAAVLAMVDAVPDARQEFKEFTDMTPAERMRAQILYALGLTEEDLEAMSPADRKAVEEKIAQLIDEELRQQLEQSNQSGKSEEPIIG